MNQTIEQLRQQAAEQYAGSFEGPYRKDAYYAHLHGQEEEYHRTKWVDVNNGLPALKGCYLIRLCVSCDPQLLFYDADKLHYAWSEVITWAEIPL